MNSLPLHGIPPAPVRHVALHFAGHVEFDALRGSALHAIHAAGRASRLQLPTGWLAVFVPLSGWLQLESADGDWTLPAGRVQVWRDGELRIDCPSSGAWVGLAGPLRAWSRHARPAPGQAAAPCLFPRQGDCPRALRRLLVRLVRASRGSAGVDCDPAMLVDALCIALAEQQRDLHECLQRCSGRTLQRRQQTLLRLLRVRHLVEVHGDGRPDLASLARSANYSPWHLIRMHRDVFGETPSEYATRLRLQRAWSLVRETRLPICEITEALGFESQSSFCRAFKNAYGATTGEVRQAAGARAGDHQSAACAA